MTPSPNDVAERLIGRPYLSHSSLSAYRTCPLRFYFRYVAGLPEEFVSSSLVFGGAIHAALERFFIDRLEDLPPPSIDMLLESYRAAWLSRDLGQVRFRDGESLESLQDLAKRMLEAFVVSSAVNAEGRLIGVEEEITRSVVQDCPDILARIDLIIDGGSEIVVRDFKTSRSKWSADQLESEADQLLLYHEAVRDLADGRPIRLEFVVLTKTKSPSIDVHRVEPDLERIRWQHEAMRAVWRGIQAGVFFPSPSTMACSTCSYRSACRKWHGPFQSNPDPEVVSIGANGKEELWSRSRA